MTYGHPDGRNNWGSTYGMEGGLSITSPVHNSPMLGGFGFLARNYFSSESVVPRLGPVDDEEYLEYYFTLDPLSGDGESDRCTNYQPVRINIICDDEQYFTLWVCDSYTERVAVRNPSGNFKPGETLTAASGATAVIKDWHRFRESNALHIIEFEEGTANGVFPNQNVTGSSSGATAECISGFNNVEVSTSIGTSFGGIPTTVMAQSPLIGTVSGFYTYPKRVGYVKYMPPRCTTLLDVSEEIAEYPDQTPGWEKSLSKNDNIDCTFKPFLEAVQNEYQDNTWGQKEKQDRRESTRKKQVNTGVFKAVPIAGTDEKLDNYQLFPVVFDGLHEANYDPSYAKKQEENGSPCLISQSGDRLRFLDGDGTDENAALTIRRQYGGAAFFAIDPNAKNGLGVVIAVSQQTEVEIELEWDDNPDTAGTALGTVTIEDKSWTQKGDSGSDVKVLTIGENIGGEGIPLKSKRNRCVEAGLAKGHQDFFDKVQNYIQCGDPFTKKEFKELTEGMSAASAVDKNYKEIQICTEDDKDLTDNKIEPNYEDSADVMKESKTFFCDLGPAYDYSIAALDYMDLAFNNLDTKVPSQTFVEVPQEMFTHGFRTLPPPTEYLKWSVFRYDPHRNTEKSIPLTIQGQWVCVTASYIETVPGTPPTGNPGEEGYDPGTDDEDVEFGNPSFGVGFSKTFNTDLTIESNWDTHRDNLIEAVDNQGNPDAQTLMAEMVEFMDVSETTLDIFDYGSEDFPDYGYIELNNYDIDGRGLAEVNPVNVGFGYLQTPTVEVSEPDLVDGTPPVVEAQIVAGRVTGFDIVNSGSGYAQEPIITIGEPTTEITGTGDIVQGSRYIQNIGFGNLEFFERLFVGVRVSVAGGGFTFNEVLRVLPGVVMNVTANGTNILTINEVQFESEIEDANPGMLLEGTDVDGLTIQTIDITTNEMTVSANVAAGTYDVNTERTVLMTYASNMTQAGANLVFTAPSAVQATARAQLYVGNRFGTSYKYSDSREIAHYDGITDNGDGTFTLQNIQRGQKETDVKRHLRGDHILLHTTI